MKTRIAGLLGVFLAATLVAQTPAPPPSPVPPPAPAPAPMPVPQPAPAPPPAPAPVPVPKTIALRPAAELDQLVAPVALYPDPLLALILPASADPLDVVLAARYLQANNPAGQAGDQPWDDSVKALVHYPDVITWMDANLEWTTALGDAFIAQRADVMREIQKLRAQAKAAGNLVNTPQQDVVTNQGDIQIAPAQTDTISVPEYDPGLVYSTPPADVEDPLLSFSSPQPAGPWLNYDCDWANSGLLVADSGPVWTHRRSPSHFWQLNPNRPHYRLGTAAASVPRATLVPGTPVLRRAGFGNRVVAMQNRVAGGAGTRSEAAPQANAVRNSAPETIARETGNRGGGYRQPPIQPMQGYGRANAAPEAIVRETGNRGGGYRQPPVQPAQGYGRANAAEQRQEMRSVTPEAAVRGGRSEGGASFHSGGSSSGGSMGNSGNASSGSVNAAAFGRGR